MENPEEEPPLLMEYLDEDLPEIEIRELVSAEEAYEYRQDQKKGINVLNPEDILFQLSLLLQSKQRAKAFLQLHQEILTDEPFSLPVPEVHLQRIDAGNEDAFFQALTEANKIDNYDTRQQELHKAFLGFETTKETPPTFTPTTPTTVLLHALPTTQTILLPKDNLTPTIQQYHNRIGIPPTSPAFRSLTLLDRMIQTTTFTSPPDPAIPVLEELQDLYQIWKAFMQYNQTLTPETFQTLTEQLKVLKQKDKEVYTFLTHLKTYQATPLQLEETGPIAFYSIQRQLFLSLRPILERLQAQLLELYQYYLQSLSPNIDTLEELPTSAHALLEDLLYNRRSLQDTINQLKLHSLRKQQQSIQTWLQEVKNWNPSLLEDKVETNYQNILKITTSSQDESYLPWSSIQEHLKEIKKGEIISKTTEELPLFLPTLTDPELLLEKDDPNEITLPIFEEPTELTLPIEHLNEGQKELFTITYRMLYNLHKASGLPLDLHQLAHNVPLTYRKTKLASIQEQLPNLTPELQIITSRITDFTLIEAPTTQATLQNIHKQFLQDLSQQLYYLLAWWITTLQQHVLNRTLNFEIWKGAANCIPTWSPYGYPMEPTKKKEGILPYLQCVIEDLTQLEGTSWHTYYTSNTDLHEQLTPLFQKEFLSQVTTLQAEFKTFDKELLQKNLKAKGLQVKETLESAVKQREKAKYLQEYMKFLKNLPSVLIQSSIAKRIYTGCCLQLLSEKYASDYDWSAYVKDAYKLKKLFATQKLEKAPRLAHYTTQPPTPTSPPTTPEWQTPLLENPPHPLWSIENWTPTLEQYMPTPALQNLPTYTEKNLSLYNKSIKNTLFPTFLNNASLQTLQEAYRKLLQEQYILITELQDSPREYNFLTKEFFELQSIHELLLSSTDHYTEVQELFRKRTLQFFLSRQLCFPAKPEFARSNTLILLEPNLDSTLLDAFLQNTFDKLQPWITEKTFNQSTNFQAYIAKMREQENNAKLRIIDKMNPEERKLYVEAKKLGIFELQEYLEQFKREPEPQGEEYINYGENNDEADMDDFYDTEV
jgi:hypothetical protein